MAFTIRGIVVDMDSHVRYAVSGKTDEQAAYQVNTINRSLEEIRVLCPQELRVTVPITWTHGTAITAAISGTSMGPDAAFANYAAGCSINIDGDASFNELATVGDGAAVSRAMFPYSGTAGSHVVNIYGDCVKLDATVDRVLGCEILHERRPLQVLNNRADWLAYQRLDGYGFRDYGINDTLPNVVRKPGVPRAVWVETCLHGNEIEYRAHCSPLPNGDFRATLDVATMAEDITTDDISELSVTVTGTLTTDATGEFAFTGVSNLGGRNFVRSNIPMCPIQWIAGTWYLSDSLSGAVWQFGSTNQLDPSGVYTPSSIGAVGDATVVMGGATTTRPVPGNRVYGILRAMCLWHWSGSPWFRNDAARKVIEQDYLNATQQTAAIVPSGSARVMSKVVY